MVLLRSYIKLMRPKQWVKNLLILAPLVFAKELFEIASVLIAIRAFAAFCLTASAVYIVNDVADIEADRAHPEKKHRPLAARTISTGQAYILLIILLAGAAILLAGMDTRFTFILTAYFVLTLVYSFKLKQVVLLDVFVIAAGGVMRVLGGAYAIDVQVSKWIVLCTLFLSLFLGFAKRRGEILLSQASGRISKRKVLLHYRVDFIDQMLTIVAAGTVISYALYTVAPRTLQVFGTEKMIYTTLFVIYGMFRYLYLIHVKQSTDNVTNEVTSDWPIMVTTLLWIVTCIVLIYSGGQISYFGE
jgi:4-hydroxybenzoate polyprenyltransferase